MVLPSRQAHHLVPSKGRPSVVHDPKHVCFCFQQIVLAWVRPTMEYACPVWHASISKEDSLTLERIQASVARRILQADWSMPKELLFQSLDWPALWWRRSVLSVCLLFDLMTNATSPLKDCLFACVSTKSSYNFRKPKQLLLPKTHSTRHQQSFFYHATLLLNTLPNSTQQASSKDFQERSGKTLVTPQV